MCELVAAVFPIGRTVGVALEVTCDELVYPNGDGDKWLKILEGGTTIGWVAVIHLGKAYGKLTEIVVTPPDPNPQPVFPESFILTDPKNPQQKAEYKFVRIVE
jgi:hypothetical protein